MNNFIKRTCTGAIFVLSILASIYFQESYYTLSALFSIFCALGLYEFYKLVNINEKVQVPSIPLIIAGLILYAGCIQIALCGTARLIIIYAFYILTLIIAELYRNKPAPMHNLAFALLGQCMVALPFSMLNLIATAENIHWILALFFLIWITDTGAYLTGMLLGKHKFFERISPKKTWEGFIGGALFAIAGSLVFWYFFPNVPVWQWIVFGILVVIFGTYGDLFESLLKRTVQIKDSGNILPGHGGILDRFDSLLFAIPVIYIYLTFLKELAS
jgi:phosphatidate cytidylyltransferase